MSGANEVFPDRATATQHGAEFRKAIGHLLQSKELPHLLDTGFPHQPGDRRQPVRRGGCRQLRPQGRRRLGTVPREVEVVGGNGGRRWHGGELSHQIDRAARSKAQRFPRRLERDDPSSPFGTVEILQSCSEIRPRPTSDTKITTPDLSPPERQIRVCLIRVLNSFATNQRQRNGWQRNHDPFLCLPSGDVDVTTTNSPFPPLRPAAQERTTAGWRVQRPSGNVLPLSGLFCGSPLRVPCVERVSRPVHRRPGIAGTGLETRSTLPTAVFGRLIESPAENTEHRKPSAFEKLDDAMQWKRPFGRSTCGGRKVASTLAEDRVLKYSQYSLLKTGFQGAHRYPSCEIRTLLVSSAFFDPSGSRVRFSGENGLLTNPNRPNLSSMTLHPASPRSPFDCGPSANWEPKG